MINLLQNKEDWAYEFPWGTSITPFISNSVKDLVLWNPDGTVNFNVNAGQVPGWIMDDEWQAVPKTTPYGNGLIISKTAYGYGVYTLVCKLPNFRGSWPAFWLIDIDDLPPEVDVFEHFRKDCFLTRFHVTTSYNGGPTYQDNKNISKAIYRLYPYDWGWTAFGLIWLPGSMTFMVNNRTSLIIKPGQFPKYPAGKMNIILGSGIGNWKPQVNKFKPFVVKSLTFEPYLKVN